MPRQRDYADREHRSNRQKPRTVRVGRSRTGKGVFATRRYRADEMIGEIVGDLIHDSMYGSDYCFRIDEDTCLEPESPFRFVNHSCDPNCEFNWFDIVSAAETTARRRVMLFAMGDIKPGDELTIDYNWSAAGAIRCRCGSDSCRGWIVDAAELNKVVQPLQQ
jgi:hypothetical protein